MKKVLILSLMSLTTLGILQSCKKGENDPFLSLRSRKARIAGEWKLSASESKWTSNGGGSSSVSTSTYNGSTETTTNSVTTGGSTVTNTSTSDYTITYAIEKDGTYKATYIEDGETETITGTWIFLKRSKEDELKNKEAILLTESSYSGGGSSSTSNDLSGQVYVIDQLKNKEMIWTNDYNYTDASGSETSTFKATFTQK